MKNRVFALLVAISLVCAMNVAMSPEAFAYNPFQRNELRLKGVNMILEDVLAYKVDNGSLPAVIKSVLTQIGSGAGKVDICSALVPTYNKNIPWDPSYPGSSYVGCTSYDSGYTISVDASGTVTVAAPYAEMGTVVTVSGR